MMKKVSVIVPVYNTPVKFLNACIKSIASQTYKNVELLLIDDGSKKEIAQECDDLKTAIAHCYLWGRLSEN